MIEIEVKALAPLGYVLLDGSLVLKEQSEQLNHYFQYDDYSLALLFNNLRDVIDEEKHFELSTCIGKGNDLSIRTRLDTKTGTWFIVKYSLNDEDASNGTIRKELECLVNSPYDIYSDKSIELIDSVLLNSGLTYLSKWSRKRKSHNLITNNLITITEDDNAGYGKIIEVEYLVNDENNIQEKKEELINLLEIMGLKELDSNLLNLMFEEYNNNWKDYYKTNKLIWENDNFLTKVYHFLNG